MTCIKKTYMYVETDEIFVIRFIFLNSIDIS